MTRDIKTLHEALRRIHRYAIGESQSPYMSIPADPDRDADLLLDAALDELESLREQVATLTRERDLALGAAAAYREGAEEWAEAGRAAYRERDAAKVDAAQLREAGARLRRWAEQWRTACGGSGESNVLGGWDAASTSATDGLRDYGLKVAEEAVYRTKQALILQGAEVDWRSIDLAAIVAEVKP